MRYLILSCLLLVGCNTSPNEYTESATCKSGAEVVQMEYEAMTHDGEPIAKDETLKLMQDSLKFDTGNDWICEVNQ